MALPSPPLPCQSWQVVAGGWGPSRGSSQIRREGPVMRHTAGGGASEPPLVLAEGPPAASAPAPFCVPKSLTGSPPLASLQPPGATRQGQTPGPQFPCVSNPQMMEKLGEQGPPHRAPQLPALPSSPEAVLTEAAEACGASAGCRGPPSAAAPPAHTPTPAVVTAFLQRVLSTAPASSRPKVTATVLPF